MLATDHYRDLHLDVATPNHELFEIHRSKISLHHAKEDYDYPTLRLPHYLSPLAGLSTRIYQTVHDGALAFLVVVSARPKRGKINADRPAYLHGVDLGDNNSLELLRTGVSRLRLSSS